MHHGIQYQIVLQEAPVQMFQVFRSRDLIDTKYVIHVFPTVRREQPRLEQTVHFHHPKCNQQVRAACPV